MQILESAVAAASTGYCDRLLCTPLNLCTRLNGLSTRTTGKVAPICLGVALLLTGQVLMAAVVVQFDPSKPSVGPFPTDYLTVPDPAQKTGVRVKMPLPDCNVQPTACTNLTLLNNFDGFDLNPRFRVRFSAPVDTGTLINGIFFVTMENLTNEEAGINQLGQVIAVNRLFYDPLTNTAYGKPNDFMDQHRRYALVVTDAIHDTAGNPVASDPAYSACVAGEATDYCSGLGQVVSSVAPSMAPAHIVAASFFTTVSATAWFDKARVALQGFTPAVSQVGPKVFNFKDIASWTFRAQTKSSPVGFTDTDLPVKNVYGIGRIAFGSYTSPDFRDQKLFIADPPTLSPVELPANSNTIYFNLFLPAYPEPAGGYPVVVICHGFGDTRFGVPTAMAPQLTALGFAVIAINFVGFGYGPQSQVVVTENDGTVSQFLAGGRSLCPPGSSQVCGYDKDGVINDYEGCPVYGALRTRDCIRQSAVDVIELIRAIRNGIDVDGDGQPDLDANQIYLDGHSAGAVYGGVAFANEPTVRAAAFECGGATIYDFLRTSRTLRPLLDSIVLVNHIPSLFNDGPSDFNDNYVLRDLPVRVNDVPGAVELQDFFEIAEWLTIYADPTAWAPHYRASPLPGIPPRQVLFQQAWGDETIPNPSGTALVRAALMPEMVRYYRNDIARSIFPFFHRDPDFYLAYLTTDQETAVAISADNMIGYFFATDGQVIYEGNDLMNIVFGTNIWEQPVVLTETLNFL
jgi:hypothetical protein